MALGVRFDLAPEKAVEFFRSKGLKPSFSSLDVLDDERARSFIIDKMMNLDLLSDVKGYVERVISEGWTFKRFREELEPELVRRGWWGRGEIKDPATGEVREVQLGSVRRLQLIYDTNLSTAYAAGHWAHIRENAQTAPYVQYSAVLDARTRAQHRAWNGLVLRHDDPWWKTHTPPVGYNCRCTVIQLDERSLAKLGKSGPDKAPPTIYRDWTNPRTGEIEKVAVGADPGWGHPPPVSRAEEAISLAREKAARAPPELRAAFLEWIDNDIARRRAALR
jgi:SPP1 gp7 family putative phage head morphogenesis protein